MERILQEYIKKTGAKEAIPVTRTEKYGQVYELRYGEIDADGKMEPTGLPVLIYIKEGRIVLLSPEDSLDLLATL